jgi:hypothetical protein
MAQLTVQTISQGLNKTTGAYAGITPTYASAASGGDSFLNTDGRTFLQIKNAGSSITVTIASRKLCSQGHDHDPVITVGATTGDVMAGPFNPEEFNDAAGLVSVTYSAVTSVTVAAFSLASQGR